MTSRAATIADLVPAALHLLNPNRAAPSVLSPQASAGDVDQVIIWLIDGFGYDQLTTALEQGLMPHLKQQLQGGLAHVDAIQTVNPSMTPVALASLLTGSEPSRHGIVGQVIYCENAAVDVLRGPLPDNLRLATPEIGELADEAGVTYDAVLQNNILRGPLTSLLHQRPEAIRTYIRESGIAAVLNDVLIKRRRGIVYLYTSGIDAINHSRGAYQMEWRAEVESLDRTIAQMQAPNEFKSWLWITADHGHVPMKGVILYSDLKARLPEIADHPAQIGTAIAIDAPDRDALHQALADIAPVPVDIVPLNDLVSSGYFGATDLGVFRARLGEYVLRPAPGWGWAESPGDAHLWSHGGISPQEMTVPWVQMPLPIGRSAS
ncbi:MAG: hypothetical protein C7B45_06655 [Sulfobacillus acidophilus]|uniref:Alkaline phosphatase family protein n=1 Tax=Sulfobacillus acidophilus TaxID=53633 RepID=A0A2T2WJU8_9FIRM|nr:MAG: hypothetical protein C7B45_06655 [Sulfobacillus acidophilus]